jgi:hypothetical protein
MGIFLKKETSCLKILLPRRAAPAPRATPPLNSSFNLGRPLRGSFLPPSFDSILNVLKDRGPI